MAEHDDKITVLQAQVKKLQSQKDRLLKELDEVEKRFENQDRLYRKYFPVILDMVAGERTPFGNACKELGVAMRKKASPSKMDYIFQQMKTAMINEDIGPVSLKKKKGMFTSFLKTSSEAINDDLFDELGELLVTSDLGIEITMSMMGRIRKKAKKLETGEELKAVLKEELRNLFFSEPESAPETARPHVIMMVGVNGTGKTTTLGKLAMRYTQEGKKVLIAAADTFRAAAIEQVEIWADRANAGIVRHKEGADPAAVAYDAVEAAMARNVDVVLIDTAGRLHTQKNLMEELKKIKRSVEKKFKGAPHEVMMVIDATTGQNAISQAKIFNEAVGLTSLSVTKLDGTAKGGIVAAVSSIMSLPIAYIGVGEAIEDLQDFDANRFVDALFD